MQVPPKQRINIVPFDSATQRDAFSVGLDGLKGVSLNTSLVQSPYRHSRRDSLVEREYTNIRNPASPRRQKEKGRQPTSDHLGQLTDDECMQKELKKLSKSHASGSFPQHASPTPVQPDRAPGPRTTTPKPPPLNLVGRPMLIPGTTDSAPPEHTPTDLPQKRGKKRELEESAITVSPQQNHKQTTPPATVVIGANGVRSRPIKKQRVVRWPSSSKIVSQRDLHHSQRMFRDRSIRETFHFNNNPPPREFDFHGFTVISHPGSYH